MNFPPKTILVAFDFSKRSMIAWRYAGLLSKKLKARLRAVYVSPWVVPPPEGIFIEPELSEPQRAAITKELDAMLGRPGAARVVEGNVADEILKAARACRADLIVMATEGPGLRRLALGSMTESVARLSRVPVLSLRSDAALPRSILAPVDVTDHSMAGFHFAEAVARSLGASLTLLHVGKDDAGLARLEAAADEARRLWGLRAKLSVVDGDLLARLLKAAAQHDLVVLAEHRRGVLRDAALGTTAERLLRRCAVPVLCVPSFGPAAPRRLTKRVLEAVGGKLFAA